MTTLSQPHTTFLTVNRLRLHYGELVAVPGVGHAPTLMEPVVLAALERFLEVGEMIASPSAAQRV
jgi:pimeloyl-ACP methyl ester carboxylesterase